MKNLGFLKVATAIPTVQVSDCPYNKKEALTLIAQAAKEGVQLLLFPELSLTGYTCGDLFNHSLLLEGAKDALSELLQESSEVDMVVAVGMPLVVESALYNCAVLFQKGKILGVVPKSHLPEYNEFYEMRWFHPASHLHTSTITLCGEEVPLGTDLLFCCGDLSIGVELCEDLWMPIPPSSRAAMAGANVILNLSASNELIGKHNYLLSLLQQQSARCLTAYLYASAGFGESSTDVVYAGNGLVLENGTILARSKRFSLEQQLVVAEIDLERLASDRERNKGFITDRDREYRHIAFQLPELALERIVRKEEKHPFVPQGKALAERCEEIFNIQLSGLARRLVHTRCKGVVVGISGGLDSTLALLVCIKAFDRLGLSRKQIVGITMPGFGTTNRTYTNALQLMSHLGISQREISIKEASLQHFKDIDHDPSVHDITYENTQARERTQILMDVANQIGGLVIGTGDLSELALGWATYNGDHMSMYGVNVSIPKTLVRHLVRWVAEEELEGDARATLLDIVDTPISPELLPADSEGNIAQKTEDSVGPYELHDFFLYYFLRFGFTPAKIMFLAERTFEGVYTRATIKKWMTTFFRRFFQQQFKRSCLPDGPKVGSIAISPRGDWRMPSDASSALWLAACEGL